MVVMTQCSPILTEERRPLEGGAPTHSHRRRWSTPADPGGESLRECFTTDDEYKEQPSHVSEVCFDDFVSCSSSSGNGYSFYLGGEMSPWGSPLLTESRPIAPPRMVMETRGEGRRGRSVRRKKDLPPFLTTLDCNGRPRFYHRRVRSEGRLEIARVAVNLPEIVSVRGVEGLRIGTVRVSQQHDEEGEGNDAVRLQVFAGVREALICIRKESEIANQSRAMAEEENGSVAKPRAKKDIAPGRLIDTYAAQCENCHQWRVIDSQEEYEDIRSRMIDDPFTCDKKQISCEDPADLDYDSSRTWVIDKPGLPKTPKGFKRSLVLRKDYSKMDTYYFTPTGKKLRSRNEVASYVEANPEFKGAPLEDFSFTVPKVMEDTAPPDPKVVASPVSPVVAAATPSDDDVSDKSTKSKEFKGKFKLEEETLSGSSPHVSPAP
ncbi:unnamed protein product [Brassica napus]|uniref:(rape) hypothetical protein n=2 Tax=Brassica TaxID=3705 RepID=A0A816PIH7_BRANA|nr:unnamed protein product [Brassica napus]